MVEIHITHVSDKGCFKYRIKEYGRDSFTDDPKRKRAAVFDVLQGSGVIFKCKDPFAVFFRYGMPDKGDINDWDRDKQINGRRCQIIAKPDEKILGEHEDKPIESLYVASAKANRQDIYAPVIVVYKPDTEHFYYDKGLSFEVGGTS